VKRYPLAGDIPPSSLMSTGPSPNPSAGPKNWYVLWRPPVRKESAYQDLYNEGRTEIGEWEVYQQGLTRTRAERLARTVTSVLSPRWFGVNVSTKVGQGTPPKINPPWTTRAIAKQWDSLSDLVGPDLMPALSKAHASRKGELVAQLDTLGCGAYGCVLETGDPGVVLKITTDSSEAEFATKVLPRMPEEVQRGFVRYHKSASLDSRHERRPLYALWRQSAESVGGLGKGKGPIDRLVGRRRNALVNLVAHSWTASQVALEALLEADDRAGELYDAALHEPRWEADLGADADEIASQLDSIGHDDERLAAALSYFQSANAAMIGTPLERVGRALNGLLEEGVFVADVHEGNLGKVPPGDDGAGSDLVWVITDPGNAVVLPSPWV
jgi:hypothetical protein